MSDTCRQCGKDLEGMEVRKVAHWSFCEPCFARLMDTAEQAKPSHAPDLNAEPTRRAASSFTEQPTLRCPTCKTEMRAEESHLLLGNRLCKTCYDVLADGLSSMMERKTQSPTETAEPEPRVPQVQVDLTAQARCASCNKWLRKIAAKVRDGKTYCPDCFIKLPPAPDRSSKADGGAEAPAIGPCCACGEQTSPLQPTEGFAICDRCLSTDRELALKLARARHLEKMKQGLR